MLKNITWEPLPIAIARGGVLSHQLFKNSFFYGAILKVEPGAEIFFHLHTNDCEWYINLKTGEIKYCARGERHGFKNESSETVYLLAIKQLAFFETNLSNPFQFSKKYSKFGLSKFEIFHADPKFTIGRVILDGKAEIVEFPVDSRVWFAYSETDFSPSNDSTGTCRFYVPLYECVIDGYSSYTCPKECLNPGQVVSLFNNSPLKISFLFIKETP